MAGERFAARLRQRLFHRIMAQEIAFFDNRPAGELVSRLTVDINVMQARRPHNPTPAATQRPSFQP